MKADSEKAQVLLAIAAAVLVPLLAGLVTWIGTAAQPVIQEFLHNLP